MATDKAVLAVIRASRPSLRSPHDRVAFAVHAAFLSAGYSLTAAGSRAASNPPEGQDNEGVDIEGWNDMEDANAFRYSGTGQEGLCKSVLVKGVAMGDTLMMDAAPVDCGGDKEPLHLEIKVPDYVTNYEGPDYGQLYKNLKELVERINDSLLSKLSPPLQTSSTSSRRAKDLKAFDQEVLDEEHLDRLGPGIAEEQSPFLTGIVYPPVPPIGVSDLLPGPGAGVFPSRINPGFGGGMLLGPSDPRWGVGVGIPEFPQGGSGVPGARFDPYGPPGVPGFEANRFTRDRRPSGRGVHPDLQHFQPF